MFPPSPINPAFVERGVLSTTLPVTNGLIVRFDASDPNSLPGVNGSAAQVWYDISGCGNHAVQATAAQRPTLVDNSLNGLRVASFDGSDWMPFTFPSPKEISIIYIASPGAAQGNSSANGEAVIGSGGTGGTTGIRWSFGLGYTAGLSNYVGATANVNLAIEVIEANGYRVRSYIKNTAGWNYWTSGVIKNLNTADTSTPTGVYAGCLGAEKPAVGSNYQLSGTIAEVLIFNRAVTNAERLAIEAYFKLKWGV